MTLREQVARLIDPEGWERIDRKWPTVSEYNPTWSAEQHLAWEEAETTSLTKADAILALVGGEKAKQSGLLLLKIYGTHFYAVVEGSYETMDLDTLEYMVEEGTCPTNLVPCEDFLDASDGSTDPHGMFELVQAIKRPDWWDDSPHVSDWTRFQRAFDKLPSPSAGVEDE